MYPDPNAQQDRQPAPQPPGAGGGAPPSPPMGGGAPPPGGGGAPQGGGPQQVPPQFARFINPNDPVQMFEMQCIDKLQPQDVQLINQVCQSVPQLKDVLKKAFPKVAFIIDQLGGGGQGPGMQGGGQQGAPQPPVGGGAPAGGAPGDAGGMPPQRTGLSRI